MKLFSSKTGVQDSFFMSNTIAPSLQSAIIGKAEFYVRQLLIKKLPPTILFHTLSHTLEVVNAAQKLGFEIELKKQDFEILILSAWLHDTGYCWNTLHHKQESIRIANAFLLEQNHPPEHVQRIVSCIAATTIPQAPKNILEQVLCDADLAHLSKKGYFKKSELLRKEISLLIGTDIPQKDWLQQDKLLLKSHTFFTNYGKQSLAAGQNENYKKIKKRLKRVRNSSKIKYVVEPTAEGSNVMAEKEESANSARGIATMFRTTSHNHSKLSAIADNKANIMITISSINISFIVSLLLRRFEQFPNLVLPTVILTLVSLLSIISAVLVTRPLISSGMFSREDILHKRTNLLFFGNFHHMPLDEYEWGMKQLMKSSDLLYSNLIHDIYSIGKMLGSKYRMLRICYSIFMYGIILSILSYAIALLFYSIN